MATAGLRRLSVSAQEAILLSCGAALAASPFAIPQGEQAAAVVISGGMGSGRGGVKRYPSGDRGS